MRRILYVFIPLLLVAAGIYYAMHLIPATALVSAEAVIENLSAAKIYIKTNSKLDVLFPTLVPRNENKLFAAHNSLENPDYNEYWQIMVKTDPKCEQSGCEIGYVSAARNEKLSLDYLQVPFSDGMKPTPKQKIALANNVTAYYTPAHAEANWHPPSIEWQVNDVVYTLVWNISDTAKAKETLMEMADSAVLAK